MDILLNFLEIDSIIQNTYSSNGLHNFKMFLYNNRLITIKDYYFLRQAGVEKSCFELFYHMGIKAQYDQDLSIISLFTKQETMPVLNWTEDRIQNIKVSGCYKYANRPFFISNQLISQYIETIDDRNNFPRWTVLYSNEELVNNAILACDQIFHEFVQNYRGTNEIFYDYSNTKVLENLKSPWLKHINYSQEINYKIDTIDKDSFKKFYNNIILSIKNSPFTKK